MIKLGNIWIGYESHGKHLGEQEMWFFLLSLYVNSVSISATILLDDGNLLFAS